MPRKSSRDPEEDPKALLGAQLRLLREAAGLTTQEALGKAIQYGQDAISRVESGDRIPTPQMYDAWLKACKATPLVKAMLDGMLAHALKANGPIPEYFQKYFDQEQKAAFLRMWGVLLIPGPLQTRDYAHAMFLAEGMDEDEATERADLRMQRRARVTGPDPAHVTALIYERALYYQVGTPETMIGQLVDLLELSRRRNVILQVVPDTGYFPGAQGPFAIASGPGISDIVDEETVQDYVTDDPDVADKVIAIFEEIRGYAAKVEESRSLISEALQWWQSQQQK